MRAKNALGRGQLSIYEVPRRKGTGYQAVMNIGHGKKPYSRTFDRKIDAERWLKEQILLQKTGESGNYSGQRMSFRQLAETWMEMHAEIKKEFSSRVRDRSMLDNHILPTFGSRRLSDVSSHQIETWLAELKKSGLAEKTCNNILGLMKTILNYGVKRSMLARNPAASVDFITLPELEYQYWDESSITKVLRYLEANDPEKLPAVVVALYTGMRDGEIWGLRWDCIDLQSGLITIRRTFCAKQRTLKNTTKSGKIRRIAIHGGLRELLQQLYDNRTDEIAVHGFDFSHAARTIRGIARQAGVKEIKFHDIRHTFATIYMKQGGNIYRLKELLGHSSIRMTERYAHHSPGFGSDAVDFISFDCVTFNTTRND